MCAVLDCLCAIAVLETVACHSDNKLTDEEQIKQKRTMFE